MTGTAVASGDVFADELKREALIYVPGLALGIEDKSITGVVTRITTALDSEAELRTAIWRTEWNGSVPAGSAVPAATPRACIFRKDGEDEKPVIDVFEYQWSATLIEPWEKQAILRRALRVLLGLFNVMQIYRTFLAARHSKKGVRQLIVASAMLLVMAAYAAVLVVAAIQTGYQLYQHATAGPSTSVSASVAEPSVLASAESPPAALEETPSTTKRTAMTWPQRLSILSSLVLVLMRKQWSDWAQSAGAALFAAHSYLKVAAAQPEIAGNLRKTCEDLAETSKYSSVSIVAYSFGSIVAIDALYPTTGPPAHSFDVVRSLITVGAPYDFVRAVRPHWSESRHAREHTPIEWVNIYSEIDLLGSNFRTDSGTGEANRGVEDATGNSSITPTGNINWSLTDHLSLMDVLTLKGFLAHGMYWGDDGVSDVNIFSAVVRQLYPGALLRA
jgi:hypothetical protein